MKAYTEVNPDNDLTEAEVQDVRDPGNCRRAWDSREPTSPSLGFANPVTAGAWQEAMLGPLSAGPSKFPPFPKAGGSSVRSQWLPNRNVDGSWEFS